MYYVCCLLFTFADLIDYEYSRYDHRGFDSGNLYCEHTFDYNVPHVPGYAMTTGDYPSLAWQRAFLGRYALESAGLRGGGALERAVMADRAAAAGAAGDDGGRDTTWHRTTCSAAELAAQFGGPGSLEGDLGLASLAREARLGILAR